MSNTDPTEIPSRARMVRSYCFAIDKYSLDYVTLVDNNRSVLSWYKVHAAYISNIPISELHTCPYAYQLYFLLLS